MQEGVYPESELVCEENGGRVFLTAIKKEMADPTPGVGDPPPGVAGPPSPKVYHASQCYAPHSGAGDRNVPPFIISALICGICGSSSPPYPIGEGLPRT